MDDMEYVEELVHFLMSYLISFAIVAVLTYIFTSIFLWKMFERMGIAPWKALIPIYNTYLLIKYVWGGYAPIAWIIIAIVCVIFTTIGALLDLVFKIILAINTAKAFNAPSWYSLLFLFVPVLGYAIIVIKWYQYVGTDHAICKF